MGTLSHFKVQCYYHHAVSFVFKLSLPIGDLKEFSPDLAGMVMKENMYRIYSMVVSHYYDDEEDFHT